MQRFVAIHVATNKHTAKNSNMLYLALLLTDLKLYFSLSATGQLGDL